MLNYPTITFYLIFFNEYRHYFFFEIWLNQFIDINFDRRKLYNEFKIEFKY